MMDNNDLQELQESQNKHEDNTALLVMNTFHRMENDNGATAEEVASYLQNKFGDVWQMITLVGKAEEILKCSVDMGYLERRGDRYVTKLVREMKCRRRRRSPCRRRRRSPYRRRRRSRCRRRKRSRCRRRRKCCCLRCG